jgi:Domain of unknown function (DUF4349)
MSYKIFLFSVLGILLAGCNAERKSELNVEEVASYANAVSLDEQAPDREEPASITERKLIRNGDLSFETSDVKKTKASIEKSCKELNAYISTENQNNYETELRYNQTIRVAADKFDLLIQKIEAEASEIKSKNINTQDVTEEFIDVEARLKTKKELEIRYREILKQAKTVQEILTIESQIASVRSEIESMEGRLKYLTSQVSYSTLNISYYETIGTDFGFGSKLGKALGSGWEYFLAFLIGIMNVWPFLVLLALIVWLAFRWDKRKRKKAEN